MKIKVYQINLQNDNQKLAFINYEGYKELTKTETVDSSIYDCVFEGQVDCKNLEDVYSLFNHNHPQGFIGRSLSVSDVIYVDEPTELFGYYYCDSIGFKKVNFLTEGRIRNKKQSEITTCNYQKEQSIISDLSITDIVKASDYINELATFIPADNEVLDYLEDIQEPLVHAIKKCKTDKDCPRCGCSLYLSDLPQYEYVCPECEENFFSIEVS